MEISVFHIIIVKELLHCSDNWKQCNIRMDKAVSLLTTLWSPSLTALCQQHDIMDMTLCAFALESSCFNIVLEILDFENRKKWI